MSRESFYVKISRHIRSMFADFERDRRFCKKLAYVRAFNHLTLGVARGGLQYTGGLLYKKQEKILLDLITASIDPVLQVYKDDHEIGENTPGAPIWVCWWDGIDDAPDLIQRCIRSVVEHAAKHPVYIVDKVSYSQYLEIPQCILESVKKGSMSLTNLADYIRVALIAKHGGLWIDATVFVTCNIPEDYFALPFFSCNSTGAAGYVADGRWATCCIGGWKNHVLFRFLKSAFEYYCENCDTFIDYFLIDYLIAIAYDHNISVKTAIDGVPFNNPHRFKLNDAMLRDEPAGDFEKYIYEDTVLYKLSRKALYGRQTPDGKESMYSYFLRS